MAMKIQMIEHDPYFGVNNIDLWADENGHQVERTFIGAKERPGPPELDTFDWLILMGGAQHAWEDDLYPWLIEEKRFIGRALSAGKPVLGICFGTQLLAEVMGGRVFAMEDKEIGWHEIRINEAGRASWLFDGLPGIFTSFHFHGDHYDLPGGLASLAQSPPSPNQAFVAPGPTVGLQFHPEYTLDNVRWSIKQYGSLWQKGPHVPGPDKTAELTEAMPDTYWLMAALLDNIVARFGEAS